MRVAPDVRDGLTDERGQHGAVIAGEKLANSIHVGADFRSRFPCDSDLDRPPTAEQWHPSGHVGVYDPPSAPLCYCAFALCNVPKPLRRDASRLGGGGKALFLTQGPESALQAVIIKRGLGLAA
jgi:hypothetical protein